MSQSVFKFEEIHDYSPENFLVSPSNSEAFEYIKNFPWSSYALSIYGPKGSGKTHLANMLRGKVTIIEDIDATASQQDLLHNLNMIKEAGNYALITSTEPLKNLGFTLPDLVSRLSAIHSVQIAAPDAELFYMLFARYFTARQLKVSDDIINYIASRTERSFAAAQEVVARIDKLSLEQKRNITIPLVKQIIGEYEAG